MAILRPWHRFLAWRRRNRVRYEQARSNNDLPAGAAFWTNLLIPRKPALDAVEELLFDFAAERVSTARLAIWRTLSRSSYGRLTVTTQRLIYQTGRDPHFLMLFRPPKSIGNVEVPLERIASAKELPWRTRAVWGASGFPGVTMVDLELVDGRTLRFGAIGRLYWQRVTDFLDRGGPPASNVHAS